MKKLLVLISIVTAIGSLYAFETLEEFNKDIKEKAAGVNTVQDAIKKAADDQWGMGCVLNTGIDYDFRSFIRLTQVGDEVGLFNPYENALRQELKWKAKDLNDGNICNVCKLLNEKFGDVKGSPVTRFVAAPKGTGLGIARYYFSKECS